MNPNLELLQPYPFERMNALKHGLVSRSNAPHIALSIGEPKHAAPQFLVDALISASISGVHAVRYRATTVASDILLNRQFIAGILADRGPFGQTNSSNCVPCR